MPPELLNALPFIAGALVLIIILAMVYVTMRDDQGRDPFEERLADFGDREKVIESLEEVELSVNIGDRIFKPMIRWLANRIVKITPQKQIEAIRKQLDMAGSTTDPVYFFLQRIGFMILLGIGAAVLGFVVIQAEADQVLLYTLGGLALGYYFPVLSLRSKIRKRQDSVLKALPDALDLLVICVEAGLGLDQAMGKVYEKWDNELALAFGRVLREIQLGKVRKDALRDMSTRIDVPELNQFVAAIVQAEQLGVSMGKILRVQSDQMRVKRRQRAQEKAQQAPVKMMIPMVLLIFPSIWIVLLGPAVIQIMNTAALGSL